MSRLMYLEEAYVIAKSEPGQFTDRFGKVEQAQRKLAAQDDDMHALEHLSRKLRFLGIASCCDNLMCCYKPKSSRLAPFPDTGYI